MSIFRMKKEDTVFVVIDIQTGLMPVMHRADSMEKKVIKMMKGARTLGMDILVTQQYTKGIGCTEGEVAVAIEEFRHIEKISFSAMRTPEFVDRLEATGKKTVVICGIEAHICVQQTVLDLLEAGYNVVVAADCISSRDKEHKELSIRRMENAGAVVTSHEAILFDLLGSADDPAFKQISRIVK